MPARRRRAPYVVPFDGSFRLSAAPTAPPRGTLAGDEAEDALEAVVERLARLQRLLMADGRWSLLLVLQGLDAAGKDGAIRALTRGLDGSGLHVVAFKAPSAEELQHDFLWRVARRLPPQGRIGIFNRSHYEEVIAVRVHPEHLEAQRLPHARPEDPAFWKGRLKSIRAFEHHLARNGTIVRKVFLNVSREEQRRRLLDRIDDPEAHWKFAPEDLEKRRRWKDYAAAYEHALRATSRAWAPWHAVPADDKKHARLAIAAIAAEALESLELEWPEPSRAEKKLMRQLRARLARERK